MRVDLGYLSRPKATEQRQLKHPAHHPTSHLVFVTLQIGSPSSFHPTLHPNKTGKINILSLIQAPLNNLLIILCFPFFFWLYVFILLD